MFVKKKHYENAIQKVKIYLGKELGLESEEDAYIILREPTEREALKLRSADDDAERVDAFEHLFESAIVDHDFWEDETVKMDDKEVVGLLFEKIDTANKIIQEYSKAVFRFRTKEDAER